MVTTALNHMTAPGLRYDAFLDLAQTLGCAGVEFRNDLPGALFDGDAPDRVGALARTRGLRILALAEVKMFNDWSETRAAEAADLIAIAQACGAEAVSLIPRNDGVGLARETAKADLRVALEHLAPMLAEAGLLGLVEPLGFESCGLRHKSDVVEVVEALGLSDRFRLIHDTFHHHLAGGGPLFAAHTAIVHISGVTDPSLAPRDMRDEHRVLVDAQDRLDNLGQIAALTAAGYSGPISFEPFSPQVHAAADLAGDLSRSFGHIKSRLEHAAA